MYAYNFFFLKTTKEEQTSATAGYIFMHIIYSDDKKICSIKGMHKTFLKHKCTPKNMYVHALYYNIQDVLKQFTHPCISSAVLTFCLKGSSVTAEYNTRNIYYQIQSIKIKLRT